MDSVELPRSGLDCVLMVHIVLLRIGTVILHTSKGKIVRETYLLLAAVLRIQQSRAVGLSPIAFYWRSSG